MFHQPEMVEVAVVARFAGGETMILAMRAAEMTVRHEMGGDVGVDLNAEYLDLSLARRFAQPPLIGFGS